ncbi:hypothetical protein MCEZE4_01625 [Burkholderiaceae bacterium]|jgi:hypothetical protein
MKHKKGEIIEDEDSYPKLPRKIDELRSLIDSMRNESKIYEKKFRAFDKSAIPRDFLYLSWNYKEAIEHLLEWYEMTSDSYNVGAKVGKPENMGAKEIALTWVKNSQASIGDPNHFPTAKQLHKGVGEEIARLALQRLNTPEDVSERTCSSWLTQMKRGTFTTKVDDPWWDF